MPLRVRSLCLFLALTTLASGQDAQDPFAGLKSSPIPKTPPSLRQKLNQIILPHVLLQDATLEQAVDLLRTKSREFDKSLSPSGYKGVKIILRLGDLPNNSSISLDLNDQPLSEVLRFVTELSGTKYRVEENAVLIVPLTMEFDNELLTRTFKVPPDFLSSCEDSFFTKLASNDPFAADSLRAESAFRPLEARRILESAGVQFHEGASASFSRLTGQLTVKNTQPNLDLIEGFIDAIHRQAPVNVAFTLTVIEGPAELIQQAGTAAAKPANAVKELAALLAQAQKPGSNIRVISDAFLEAQSGVRSTFATLHEHAPQQASLLGAGIPTVSTPAKPRKNGLQLAIEPLVSSDRSTMKASVNLTLSTAPPSTQQQAAASAPPANNASDSPITDISNIHLDTDAVIKDGETSLLSVTSFLGTPQEKADTLCAVFLTAKLRTVEVLPPPQPQSAARSSIPSGMTFFALDAPDGLFDEVLPATFLPVTPPTTLKVWLTERGITFPPGSSIEQHDGQLWLVNTPGNISSIASVVDQLLRYPVKIIACTLHTVEAPAPFLRDLARHSISSVDDSAMFAAVEAAVAHGEAGFIDSAFLSVCSGSFATRQSAREQSWADDSGIKDGDRRSFSFTPRTVGSVFDITATVGSDRHSLYVTYEHELHPASQQSSGTPAPGFHFHKTSTTSNFTDGSINLISLTPPPGPAQPGRLWATFLKCDLVPILTRQPAPSSPLSASSNSPGTEKLVVRHFAVNELLQNPENPSPLAGGADPFAPASAPSGGSRLVSASTESPDTSLQQTFESSGVDFPPGAYVRVLGPSRGFIVRNTPANLAKISFGKTTSKSAVITTHIFQAPGPLLRQLTAQAARKADHRAELNQLLAAVKAGAASCLTTASMEALSGVFSTLKQGAEHTALTDAFFTKDGTPEIVSEHRNVGLRIELTPTLDEDRKTVMLTIAPEFDTAPPFEHREHALDAQGRPVEFPLTDYFISKLKTNVAIHSGATRLISLCKPTGKPEFEKEDILQAIFITCDILRPEK